MAFLQESLAHEVQSPDSASFWRILILSIEWAATEIHKFDIAALRYEDILDFDVSVDNVLLMTVVESTSKLARKLAGQLFLKAMSAMIDDIVKQLAAANIFEHEIPVIIRFGHISHVYNKRMAQ